MQLAAYNLLQISEAQAAVRLQGYLGWECT